jgi:glycosyltransferase involved in cell wall biosynthesis
MMSDGNWPGPGTKEARLLIATNAPGRSVGGSVFITDHHARLYSGYGANLEAVLTIMRGEIDQRDMTSPLPEGLTPVWIPAHSSSAHFLRLAPRLVLPFWRLLRQADVVLVCMPSLNSVLALVLARLARTPSLALMTGAWTYTTGVTKKGRVGRALPALTATVIGLLSTRLLSMGQVLLEEVASFVRPKAMVVNASAIQQGDFLTVTEYRLDHPVLLYVGKLVGTKRVDILIEAVARLRDRGLHPRLTLVGDGPERGALSARAAALDVGDRVCFCGFTDDRAVLRDHYKESFAFVFASETEGISVAVLEAMAGGSPSCRPRGRPEGIPA